MPLVAYDGTKLSGALIHSGEVEEKPNPSMPSSSRWSSVFTLSAVGHEMGASRAAALALAGAEDSSVAATAAPTESQLAWVNPAVLEATNSAQVLVRTRPRSAYSAPEVSRAMTSR